MIGYMIRATLLALCLASPLMPAVYMAWDQGLLGADMVVPCDTDTECMELNGGDGYGDK